MTTWTRRQRDAFYSGIADMPPIDDDPLDDDFEYGYDQRPHLTLMRVLLHLKRVQMRHPRRPLPGVALVA